MLEPTQEKDLLLAISRLERIEFDVKEALVNLRNIKETYYLTRGRSTIGSGEIKKIIEEYATQEGFDDVLGIISGLIEERGDMLDYSIRNRDSLY